MLRSICTLVNPQIRVSNQPITDTSRNPRSGEAEGQDYFFVTREEFESDMNRDRFLEHGELKGAYYGTSFMTIKRIMESYQIPILDVHPQVRIMFFLQ